MEFDSQTWLLTIFCISVSFWLCSQKYRFDLLAASSLVLLAAWDWRSAIFIVSAAITVQILISVRDLSGRLLFVSLLSLFLVLFAFKSFTKMEIFSGTSFSVLPLGISYMTLRCGHLLIEKYKKNIQTLTFRNIVHYLFFVPTFIIGPIHRYEEFSRSLRRHRWRDEDLFDGLFRIFVGFIKILLLCNVLTLYLTSLESRYIGVNYSISTYITMITIGVNLYLNFSGYSDVAIGFSKLLGVTVPENFNSPFFSRNISIFWSRWHISLTSWARDYVYTSVAATTRSASFAALISMMFIAVWHEPTWQYILWGCYHGLGIYVWQRFQSLKIYFFSSRIIIPKFISTVLSALLTIYFVLIGFMLVREDTLGGMMQRLSALAFLS